MNPWPPENVIKLREDATAGLTLKECAAKRNFNPFTVRKHARLNGIEFRPGEALPAGRSPRFMEHENLLARECLHREIVAAKHESHTTPLYRRWPDDA